MMSQQQVVLVTPRRPSAQSGNSVTAGRWADQLRSTGSHVEVLEIDESVEEPSKPLLAALERADVALVLHARRGASATRWWRTNRGDRPLIVALTGTDLYLDMPEDPLAMDSAKAADALIVLQEAALDRLARLDPHWAAKAWVVHQSVDPSTLPTRRLAEDPRRAEDRFQVVVLAHFRSVKDPLLAARAARLLPATSRIDVRHGGAAPDPSWAAKAIEEQANNPRYHWYGELSRPDALTLLAGADVLACTSVAEGGANVVTEALALGVPVVGTRIDGNTGLLGADHPGLVPVGDAAALAEVLHRFETDTGFRADLQHRTDQRRSITLPASERRSLIEVVHAVCS